MRCSALFASCLASAVLAATGAIAGPPDTPTISPHAQELTCAPRLLDRNDSTAPRVLGGRDRYSPGMFGPREVIVLSSGDGSLAAGQLYVAYRRVRSRVWTTEERFVEDTAQNAGIVRIDSVIGDKATATIVWACDGVDVNDRLEPFAPSEAPMPATGAFPADSATLTPALAGASVQLAQHDRRAGAARDLMLVSRVQGQDVAPGQRVAFFRRYQRDGGPVSVLGEGVVQSVGERTYLVQIVGSRDAIEAGDLVGPASR